MNQWEIWTWAEHPAVIVSHPDRASRKDTVEVVACSTSRGDRALRPTEVLLDNADGLNHETICYCDLIYSVPRSELRARGGLVVVERRRAIVRSILQSHGWVGL